MASRESTFLREQAKKDDVMSSKAKKAKKSLKGQAQPLAATVTAPPISSSYTPISTNNVTVISQAGGSITAVLTGSSPSFPVLTAGKAVSGVSSLASLQSTASPSTSVSGDAAKSRKRVKTKAEKKVRFASPASSQLSSDFVSADPSTGQSSGLLVSGGSRPIPAIPALSLDSVALSTGTYAAGRTPLVSSERGSRSQTIADSAAEFAPYLTQLCPLASETPSASGFSLAGLSTVASETPSVSGISVVSAYTTPLGGPSPASVVSVNSVLPGTGVGLSAVIGTGGSVHSPSPAGLAFGAGDFVHSPGSYSLPYLGFSALPLASPSLAGVLPIGGGSVAPSCVVSSGTLASSGLPVSHRGAPPAGNFAAASCVVSTGLLAASGFPATHVSAPPTGNFAVASGRLAPSSFPAYHGSAPSALGQLTPSGLPISHLSGPSSGFSGAPSAGYGHAYPSVAAANLAFPAGIPGASSTVACTSGLSADPYGLDQRIATQVHSALSAFFAGNSGLQSTATVPAPSGLQSTATVAVPSGLQSTATIPVPNAQHSSGFSGAASSLPQIPVLVSSEEDSSESEDDQETDLNTVPSCTEPDLGLLVADSPASALDSDAALVLKGIKATADAVPSRVQHISTVPMPGRSDSSTTVSDKLRLAPDPAVSSWVHYHLNSMRGWKDRGAAPWSETSSCADFSPHSEKFLRPKALWRGNSPVLDPTFPAPLPSSQEELGLCAPRSIRDKHKVPVVKDTRGLAVERASQSTLEALSIISNFQAALRSVLLDPNDPTQLRSEPDTELTFSLLQSLPGALSHAANAASCTYINARLARRDELLEHSNFSPQVSQQLRLAPIGSSLFDLGQLQAARSAHTADLHKPLTPDNLVKALRAASAPPAQRQQWGAGKQSASGHGRKRKAPSGQQHQKGQPAKRGRGGRSFSFKKRQGKDLN